MKLYEQIERASLKELAKILYFIEDIDVCNYCKEPYGTLCADELCINAMIRVLTELEYKDV